MSKQKQKQKKETNGRDDKQHLVQYADVSTHHYGNEITIIRKYEKELMLILKNYFNVSNYFD